MSATLWGQPLAAAMVDLDGTLVDTLGDFHAALNAMLAELGLPAIAAAAIAAMVGKGSEHLVESALNYALALDGQARTAIKTEALLDTACASYQRHYGAINGEFARVYPGVDEGLQSLRSAGLPLACLTNKPQRYAQELLHAKGLAGYFDLVFGGDRFARKKPDPLPLLQTCAALGTPAARTLMLGDSSNDAAAARAAGCPVLLLDYGYNHGQPIASVDADGYLSRLGDWRQPRRA